MLNAGGAKNNPRKVLLSKRGVVFLHYVLEES